MKIDRLREIIDEYNYAEPPVLSIDCNNFCEDVLLAFDDDFKAVMFYHFKNCFSYHADYVYKERKPIKELLPKQRAFYMQEFELTNINVKGHELLKCHFLMLPLEITIICEDIDAYRKDFSEITDERWLVWKDHNR